MRTANNDGPVRSCVGCRKRFAQAALVRFVRGGGEGAAWLRDRRRRAPGRGAYLCSADCVARVRKNRRYPGLAEVAGADFASDLRACMIEPTPGPLERNDMK